MEEQRPAGGQAVSRTAGRRRKSLAGFHILVLVLVLVLLTTPTNAQKKKNKNKDEKGGEKTFPPEEEETSTGPTLTGIPQIDYIHDPNLPHELIGYDMTDYPFYKRVPKAGHNFTCDDRLDGFYASVPHKCQVYYNCLFNQRYDFLCPNYTVFDQVNFICHYASTVDCDNSERYYDRNKELYVTTTTTTPAPRIIYIERDRPRPRPIRPLNIRRPNRRRPPPRSRPPPKKITPDQQTTLRPVVDSPQYYDEDYYNDDYYYYDEVSSTTTTTTPRPIRKKINRVGGGGRIRGGGGRRRGRPRPGSGGRRRRIKTTTTTPAPVEYSYYDDYYYYDDVAYEDEPKQETTRKPPVPQRKRQREEPVTQTRRVRPGQGRRPNFRRPQSVGAASANADIASTDAPVVETPPARRQFKNLRSKVPDADVADDATAAPDDATAAEAPPVESATTEPVITEATVGRRRRIQSSRRTSPEDAAVKEEVASPRSPGSALGGRRSRQ